MFFFLGNKNRRNIFFFLERGFLKHISWKQFFKNNLAKNVPIISFPENKIKLKTEKAELKNNTKQPLT